MVASVHPASRTRGFSSVEVLLACVLIGVALLPSVRTTIDTGREAAFSEAYLLAHLRAEALVALSSPPLWTEPDGAAEVELPVPPEAGERPSIPGADPREYEEGLVFSALEDGLLKLTATVRWTAPLKGRAGRDSVAVAVRLLVRPEGSWLAGPPARPKID